MKNILIKSAQGVAIFAFGVGVTFASGVADQTVTLPADGSEVKTIQVEKVDDDQFDTTVISTYRYRTSVSQIQQELAKVDSAVKATPESAAIFVNVKKSYQDKLKAASDNGVKDAQDILNNPNDSVSRIVSGDIVKP